MERPRLHGRRSNLAEYLDFVAHGVVRIDATVFADGYVNTETEFELRDLYESQVPFIRWLRGTIPASEERDDMEVLIHSIERKYLLEIDGH